MLETNTVHLGDCLEVMKQLEDNSISVVISDPPYGLGEVKDISALLTEWITGGDGLNHVSGGFMNKKWDATVPPPIYWKECFRVLKPGGHVLVFSGQRTQDLMGISLRLAGFVLRDAIEVISTNSLGNRLNWTNGSGFPKGQNLSVAIDTKLGHERKVVGVAKNGTRGTKDRSSMLEDDNYEWSKDVDITEPTSEEAKKYDGWLTSLKPAQEPILVFMKPLGEKTFAENVLKYGTGGMNIDATRVPAGDSLKKDKNSWMCGGVIGWDRPWMHNPEKQAEKKLLANAASTKAEMLGRYPANLLLVHTPYCKRVGDREIKTGKMGRKYNRTVPKFSGKYNGGKDYQGDNKSTVSGYGNTDGKEIVGKWECHPCCPIRLIDEQSGYSKSGAGTRTRRDGSNKRSVYGGFNGKYLMSEHQDEGGASRYFSQFEYQELDGIPNLKPVYRKRKRKGFMLTGSEENEQTANAPDSYGDKGGASRYFSQFEYGEEDAFVSFLYEPKAQKRDRHCDYTVDNRHETVKPIALMQWLVRLGTPPDGIILDPFAGSGTTVMAAIMEGQQCIGIERDPKYQAVALQRVAYAKNKAGLVTEPLQVEPTLQTEEIVYNTDVAAKYSKPTNKYEQLGLFG